jgi:hypothetical protein
MDKKNILAEMTEVFQALGAHYYNLMVDTARQAGLSGEWNLLMPAWVFEPTPISVELLQVRSPYTRPGLLAERLSALAEASMLVSDPKGGYHLTANGREITQKIYGAAYMVMEKLQSLPPADLERLAGLLQRMVDASLAGPEPPGKWSLRLSCKTNPGDQAHLIVRIDQYLSDLWAYRDDAHLASWRPLGVNGPAWDALTCLWRGEGDSSVTIQQKLQRRGFSAADYAQQLGNLVGRGWVEEITGLFRLTIKGSEIRQAAEEMTDRYFYAPWACLSMIEFDDLYNLLVRFRETL